MCCLTSASLKSSYSSLFYTSFYTYFRLSCWRQKSFLIFSSQRHPVSWHLRFNVQNSDSYVIISLIRVLYIIALVVLDSFSALSKRVRLKYDMLHWLWLVFSLFLSIHYCLTKLLTQNRWIPGLPPQRSIAPYSLYSRCSLPDAFWDLETIINFVFSSFISSPTYFAFPSIALKVFRFRFLPVVFRSSAYPRI